MSKGTRNRWLTNRKLLLVWVAFGILTPISWLGYQIFGPRPAIRVSYETTRITSPLTDDGYVDYAGHVLATYPHSVESLPELKWPLLEIDATDYLYIHYPKISAKANNELDRDRYRAYFKAFHQRIKSAPINRFSHPTTAIQIAANRDWYEALEAALQKPVIIARNELQNEDREHTLAFNATEGPDLRMLAARVNLHLGEGQTGEAFRVIDCLRLSVERRLKVPLGNQPYWDLLENEQTACRCDMIAAMVAPQLSVDHWRWIESLPTERPITEMTNGIDINIRFYLLDLLQFFHRKPEKEWKSWDDFLDLAAKQISEPVDWNGIARGINTAIDAVIEGLPDANTFTRQNELYHNQARMLAECRFAESDVGEEFPIAVKLYFQWYFESANRLAALYRQTHLVFELSEWQRIHGHFPDQLAELPVRNVRVGTALLDPFTGEPMKYQRTAKGFRLYSVGPNAEDDFGIEDPDQIPAAFRINYNEDGRTGRTPDDRSVEWPPAAYRD